MVLNFDACIFMKYGRFGPLLDQNEVQDKKKFIAFHKYNK